MQSLGPEHSTQLVRHWSSGEANVRGEVQVQMGDPGGWLEGELLHEAGEEQEKLHLGQ